MKSVYHNPTSAVKSTGKAFPGRQEALKNAILTVMEKSDIKAIAATLGAVFVCVGCVGGNDTLKIMSYNVCHCAPHRGGAIHIDVTAERIMDESPDVVCLQELDVRTRRSHGVDQAEALADRTDMYSTFGRAIDYKGGMYGVAILSKEKPVSSRNVPLPGGEKRTMLVCEFNDYVVATTHLSLVPSNRQESVGIIRNALAGYSKPVFLTGDWNATPASPTLVSLKEFFTILSPQSGIATFNSRAGRDFVIDYIAVDSAHADSIRLRRSYLKEDLTTSDHSPLCVEVDLTNRNR